MPDAPLFIQGQGVDALAEYTAFLHAVGEPAAHLLAEFVHLQQNGLSALRDADLNATQVIGLCCRVVEAWAVFYVAKEGSLSRNTCRVGIVHVGRVNPPPFGQLESEAEKRLREYGL